MDLTVELEGADGAFVVVGDRRYRCAIGKGGIRADKREGDGATPVGRLPLRRVFYRPDRLAPPATGLEAVALDPDLGWSDDPADPAHYNRPVRRPYGYSHETMWREDGLYDIVVELGYNDDPPVPGLGSAIFMHVARDGYLPTEGCVALRREELLEVLARCGEGDCVLVPAPSRKVDG